MDDLISRQAAIDEIIKAFDRETLLNSLVRKVAVDAVKALPSAQSEIVVEISKDATDVMESVVRLAKALAEVLESERRENDAEIH